MRDNLVQHRVLPTNVVTSDKFVLNNKATKFEL